MTEHAVESFDVLLREKLAELDAEEAPPAFVEDDPVDRLRLEARQSVLQDAQGPMPRGGHQVYVTPQSPPADSGKRHLNLLR